MIEVIGLSKTFASSKVLEGLSLTIKKGETKVVIGRSGCGKSVLLKHITGILKPDLGSIIINGRDVTQVSYNELNRIRMNMSLVFQGGALFD